MTGSLIFLVIVEGFLLVSFLISIGRGEETIGSLQRELMRARQLLYEEGIDYAPDESGLREHVDRAVAIDRLRRSEGWTIGPPE